MYRGSPPLATPPEPAPMFGQTRTLLNGDPLQLIDRVAVLLNTVLAVRLMVPKFRFVMVNAQLRFTASAEEHQHAANTASTTNPVAFANFRHMLIGIPPV